MNSKPNLSLSRELADRKESHIDLALKAQTLPHEVDGRFNYEPLFFSHPTSFDKWPSKFLNHDFDYPVWISSMTGGTLKARDINENLAWLSGKYKLGMGLGSCRPLLEDLSRVDEFAVKKHMGAQPLYANLGLAQVEELIATQKTDLVHEMVKTLEADGLIIHLNPLQEWLQPEGDRYTVSPLVTLQKFLEGVSYPVLIKEVGQGMGPKSLKALLELPIAGIEFGAFGGTNFSLLESLRAQEIESKKSFINVGHTALEMVEFLNALPTYGKAFIISGGVKTVLDGYALHSTLKAPSLIGMASNFLRPAMESKESLEQYFLSFREALLTAKGVLSVKGDA